MVFKKPLVRLLILKIDVFQVVAPTGNWKYSVGIAAFGVAIGIWGYMWCKKYGEQKIILLKTVWVTCRILGN